jgi:predicted CopG family antitoxin
MAKRITIIVEDDTYEFLKQESERTSISICELVRRALERAFPLRGRRRTTGVEIRVAVWRRRIFGRRPGVAFDP